MATEVQNVLLNLTQRMENLEGTFYGDIVDRYELIWEEVSGSTVLNFKVINTLDEAGTVSATVSTDFGKDLSETAVGPIILFRLGDTTSDLWASRLDYGRLSYYGGDDKVTLTLT